MKLGTMITFTSQNQIWKHGSINLAKGIPQPTNNRGQKNRLKLVIVIITGGRGKSIYQAGQSMVTLDILIPLGYMLLENLSE